MAISTNYRNFATDNVANNYGNLGKYLIDISKYLVTGVIIASTFKDLDDKFLVYILSAFVAFIALCVGLILTNKKKGN